MCVVCDECVCDRLQVGGVHSECFAKWTMLEALSGWYIVHAYKYTQMLCIS